MTKEVWVRDARVWVGVRSNSSSSNNSGSSSKIIILVFYMGLDTQ